MTKFFFTILSVLVLNLPVWAQRTSTISSEVPPLVVIINVEQMRVDYIQRYWDKFQSDGFKRLYSEGAVCSNTRLDLHVQKISTGAATLFTGVYPSIHGIVNDSWYDRLKEKEIRCVGDDFYLTVGSDSHEGECSAVKLLSPTIGDIMKIYSNNRSKVFSVAMNDVSAIFSAGHAADAAYWFDTQSGNMISSSYYLDVFPDWVRVFNDKKFADLYSSRDWNTLLPVTSYTESLNDDYILEKGYYGKWNTFPYSMKKLYHNAGSYKFLKTTPFGNTIIKDFAVELIDAEKLGQDNIPDLLCVSFTSMDYENGSFGPSSVEMEDTYLRLDQEIASLLNYIDKKTGKGNSLVLLTSTNSGTYPINYLKEEFHMPVGEVSPENMTALLKSYLNILYGQGDWIEQDADQQIYLNHDLIEKKGLLLTDVQRKVASFINQFEGVKIALPASAFEEGDHVKSQLATISNSFNFKRSGDILYSFEDGWQPVYKFKRTIYNDNSHIPLVWFGNKIKKGKIIQPDNALDIVPTILEILNIPVPDSCSGQILEKVLW